MTIMVPPHFGQGWRVFGSSGSLFSVSSVVFLGSGSVSSERLIFAILSRRMPLARNGALDTINETGQRVVQRQLDVPPTLTIRPGFAVRVIVTRDLVFAPCGG